MTAFSPAPGQFAAIFADVTERRRAELALARRDALLECLSFAADRFLQAEDWEQEMPGVLARLGQASEVSRVYLFQNETGPTGEVLASQRYEWCAPSVASQIGDPVMQHASYRELGFSRWEEQLMLGNLIRGHVRDLPPREREVMIAQGVQSLVEVPIHVDGRVGGGLLALSAAITSTSGRRSRSNLCAPQVASSALPSQVKGAGSSCVCRLARWHRSWAACRRGCCW